MHTSSRIIEMNTKTGFPLSGPFASYIEETEQAGDRYILDIYKEKGVLKISALLPGRIIVARLDPEAFDLIYWQLRAGGKVRNEDRLTINMKDGRLRVGHRFYMPDPQAEEPTKATALRRYDKHFHLTVRPMNRAALFEMMNPLRLTGSSRAI